MSDFPNSFNGDERFPNSFAGVAPAGEADDASSQELSLSNLWRTLVVALRVAAPPLLVGVCLIVIIGFANHWSESVAWVLALIYAVAAGTACILVLRRLFSSSPPPVHSRN
jgi:hypothetical protein